MNNYIILLLAMYSLNKSSFLVTDQSTLPENSYNSSILKIRKRINILSAVSSASTSSVYTSSFRKHSLSTN